MNEIITCAGFYKILVNFVRNIVYFSASMCSCDYFSWRFADNIIYYFVDYIHLQYTMHLSDFADTCAGGRARPCERVIILCKY